MYVLQERRRAIEGHVHAFWEAITFPIHIPIRVELDFGVHAPKARALLPQIKENYQ